MSDSTDINQPPFVETDKIASQLSAYKNAAEPERKPAYNVFEHGYDPVIAEQSVRPDRLLFDPRFWRIADTLRTFTMGSFEGRGDRLLSKEARSARLRKRARHLTQTLVELGPTFIKLGQFLSVRRDFLPAEVSEELVLLQDRVPQFPLEQVVETIKAELGAAPEELFLRFDSEPLASASIGQVHRATLKDGRLVAVKVQRPKLAGALYQDLGCMRWFARFSKFLHLKGDWDTWLELSDEFGKTLFEEIDYIQEGRNADRLRHALRDRNDVIVPRIFWKYTGRRVITLEYLEGTKIDQVNRLEEQGFNLEKIGRTLIQCYMDQVLTYGFFHADPHAGNLAIAADGRIVVYDYGMMGEITPLQREALLGCIAAVVNRNTIELSQHLLTLGAIRKTANMAPIERALQPFIEYYSGRSIRDLDFSHLEKDIDEIAGQRALRLPPSLAYLIRTGATLEGIARILKPDFSFVDAARPTLQKWVVNQPSQVAGILRALYRRKTTSKEVIPKDIAHESEQKSFNGNRVVEVPGLEKHPAEGNGKSHLNPTNLRAISSKQDEDIAKINARIEQLEGQLRNSSQRINQTSVLVMIQLLVNVLFIGQSNVAVKSGFDTSYFLIGNLVMGAIILWQLVAKPGSLLKRSNSPGE
jgi:predicted unusual protein kinase regulating ubiquinone biosynthesis (AarF/ABC1/UbiB family)